MDANFGATAGIAEMLIQSHAGMIHLLPALPKDWPSGEVKGLKTRGGFVVDIVWNIGELVEASISSELGKKLRVGYKEKYITLNIEKGETKSLLASDFK